MFSVRNHARHIRGAEDGGDVHVGAADLLGEGAPLVDGRDDGDRSGRLLRGGLLGLRAAAGAAALDAISMPVARMAAMPGDQTMRVNVHIAAFFEYAVDVRRRIVIDLSPR